MGIFTSRAVLRNDLDHEMRLREFWQCRAEDFEKRYEAEIERNRARETYLLNLLLTKAVKASPVPDSFEPEPAPSEPEPDTYLEEFKNTEFAEWAKQAGVTRWEANLAWEQNKHLYGGS